MDFIDERNDLVYSFWKIAELLNPNWVIMENVPGFINFNQSEYLKNIKIFGEKIGYKVKHKIINTADYGVPQTRKRHLTEQ